MRCLQYIRLEMKIIAQRIIAHMTYQCWPVSPVASASAGGAEHTEKFDRPSFLHSARISQQSPDMAKFLYPAYMALRRVSTECNKQCNNLMIECDEGLLSLQAARHGLLPIGALSRRSGTEPPLRTLLSLHN